jgi:hypothetical protein
MPRLVISDTSPLRYLILIGQADLLPALYSEVLIPEAVADELNQPATPDPVRRWDCPSPRLASGGSECKLHGASIAEAEEKSTVSRNYSVVRHHP